MAEVSVYGLIDPRNEAIFYIGCSISPKRRLYDHCNDPASSAWSRCKELRGLGLRPKSEVIAAYEDKQLALAHEMRLINELPGLLNKDTGVRKCLEGCLCGRHDPTPYLGNPNWSEEFDYKLRKRL